MKRTDLGNRAGSFLADRRPARTLSALLLSAFALGAAVASPAVAQAPYEQVLINGKPTQRCDLDQSHYRYCNAGGAVITILGPDDALQLQNDTRVGPGVEAPQIIEADFSFSTASQNRFIRGHIPEGNGTGRCEQLNGRLFCRSSNPVDVLGVDIRAEHPVTDGVVANVIFTQCAGKKRDALAFGPPLAPRADKCKPPSGTTITKAKVNGNLAVFKFDARHATGFTCDLFANGALAVRHSCRSPQSVGPLPPGRYVFTVAGVNDAGFDKPDKKRFSIG
jgi:hypothetical protein